MVLPCTVARSTICFRCRNESPCNCRQSHREKPGSSTRDIICVAYAIDVKLVEKDDVKKQHRRNVKKNPTSDINFHTPCMIWTDERIPSFIFFHLGEVRRDDGRKSTGGDECIVGVVPDAIKLEQSNVENTMNAHCEHNERV